MTVRVKATDASRLFETHAERMLETRDFIEQTTPQLTEVILNHTLCATHIQKIAEEYRQLGEELVEIRTGAFPGDLHREAFRIAVFGDETSF